jgi:predicted PurR-regulated permease PerM
MIHWSWQRIALATVLVAALIFGAALLYRCGYALLVAFVAPLLATPLLPVVRLVERLRISRPLAVVLVHFTVVACGILCVVALLPLSLRQGAELVESLPSQYAQAHKSIRSSGSEAIRGIADLLPEELPVAVQPARAGSEMTLNAAWSTVSSISWNVFLVIACILASIYWSIERQRLIQSAKLLVPDERRQSAAEVFEVVESKLGAFVRGQAVLCVLVGLMAWIAYWWIGLPYAAILALVAGICEAVPVIGPIVGAIPAVVVAFGQSPTVAMWTIVANVLVASIESYLLVPRIMNRAVGVHPIVTLLSISALFALLGPIGGVLAVPLAAIIQLIFRRWVFPPSASSPSARRDRIAVLQYRVREVLNDLYVRMSRPHPDASVNNEDRCEEDIESLARDLLDLLQRGRAEGPSS